MKDILNIIAENKKREIEALYLHRDFPLFQVRAEGEIYPVYSMSESLRLTPGGIIAEFKRRSPSKGDISPMADVADIIPQYVSNGAAACSVLTDTRFFGGSKADLAIARTLTRKTPLLRKDFILSYVQIYEARVLGASAILLIAAILSEKELSTLFDYAHSLGLEALVEIHNMDELDKITFKPDMLGVNNRNLSSFHTDVNHSFNIAKYLPSDWLLVAESGIKKPEDIKRLKDAGFSGFLIGEAFMSSPDPGATLKQFINEGI